MKAIIEKVGIPDQCGIHAFVFENTYFDMPWHVHPEYELTLILKSAGIRYVGNNVSDFTIGDLVLLGSNLPHCWKNTEDHKTMSRSLVIQWSKEVIHDLPVFDRIWDLLEEAQRGLFLQDKDGKVAEMMHTIVECDGLGQYLKLVELLAFIAKEIPFKYVAGASYAYDISTHTNNRLDLIQNYVKQQYRDKIKLADVAAQVNMNEQAFSRFFSKTMKKPFFSYLNEYRINISSRFIIETDLQMAEIAYQCGYESLPFFYKQFKKYKGYTPLEFRKMYSKV
ncbi:MAG: AraC family transcriptional regulator [Bacteroidota bacterium]